MQIRPKSIRWQLPLSYAAIALISTLALGLILLLTLRSYYGQRESAYLDGNAGTINRAISQMIVDGVPRSAIQSQIAGYSFLSQVRIRVLSQYGNVVADSGVPTVGNRVSISAEPEDDQEGHNSDLNILHGMVDDSMYYLLAPQDYVDLQEFQTSIEMPIGISVDGWSQSSEPEFFTPVITLDFVRSSPDTIADSQDAQMGYTNNVLASSTLYGFGLNEGVDASGERSTRSVTQDLVDPNGEVIGTLELSHGPAYGRQIVNRVAYGWAGASVLAVLVAAGAGWTISRRISVPLMALTATTTHMAQGDLSVRSHLKRDDELGMLSSTFNDMAERIENTVNALRRFVADAAHELHTPITALNTNLELAIDEHDPQVRDHYIQRARKQVKRLEVLTDGLLDLSRIEAGLTAAPHKLVMLNPLVQELSEVYASRSDQAQINFVLDLPDTPIAVCGNEQQLRSAIGNLMDNAIKFTPAGETVTVHVVTCEDAVKIHVRDCGIGIPPDEIAYIFSRFHRGRNAVTFGGSGLGLAIVHGVVEAHHGTVKVDNLNPGTQFTMCLPRPR